MSFTAQIVSLGKRPQQPKGRMRLEILRSPSRQHSINAGPIFQGPATAPIIVGTIDWVCIGLQTQPNRQTAVYQQSAASIGMPHSFLSKSRDSSVRSGEKTPQYSLQFPFSKPDSLSLFLLFFLFLSLSPHI